jgi:hypothetical protein
MKMHITTTNGDIHIGSLEHRDESYVMLKIRNVLRVLHWDIISDVYRLEKTRKVQVNINIFRKSRY